MPKQSLTKEKIQYLCEVIAQGNFVSNALDKVQINRKTHYNWFNRGKRELEEGKSTKFTRYTQRVEKAKAEAICRANAVLQKKIVHDENLTAIMFFLERMNPENYGAKKQIEMDRIKFNVPGGQVERIKITEQSISEIDIWHDSLEDWRRSLPVQKQLQGDKNEI